jgi:prepilin-type processing-associated H-X9-DG protein
MVAMHTLTKVALGIFAIFILAVVLFPVFAPVHTNRRTSCLTNLKQDAVANVMYAGDYDERLPTAAWMDLLSPYQKNEDLFRCVSLSKENKEAYGFAYNSTLFGTKMEATPEPPKMETIYDSTSVARNAADPVSSLPVPGRHGRRNFIAYLDGHAKAVTSPPK